MVVFEKIEGNFQKKFHTPVVISQLMYIAVVW